ncbi:MAG: DNA polymerase I, partial [Armatimonadota bacterium]
GAPSQMADFKGLKGDSSDNIPGVPGIGDKTAALLLQEYGNIESIIENADNIKQNKIRESLKNNVDIAILSKKLATIETQLPVKFDINDYQIKQPDYSALKDLFMRLEFRSMIAKIPQVETAERKQIPQNNIKLGKCTRISSDNELRDLISGIKQSGRCAVHYRIKNNKTVDAELLGIAVCIGEDSTAYIKLSDKKGCLILDLSADEGYVADIVQIKEIIEDDSIVKYCHDIKMAYAAFKNAGIELKNAKFDTMLAAYLIDNSRSSFQLGDVVFEQLSLELPKETDQSCDETTSICNETESIYRITPILTKRLQEDGMDSLYNDIELPLAPILAEMEMTGICVDRNALSEFSSELEKEISNLQTNIYQQAGEEFNIGSPKQLGAVLYEKMGLTASKKTKTGYSTSANVLEELAAENPIVDDILKYRELTKLKTTYADALPKLINPKTNRIHTTFNQAVTATGRLSSSDPNLQNIPIKSELGRKIRQSFIADEDMILVSADYSQIELRVLAHITQDSGLVSAFENDEDIHLTTATKLFGCSADMVDSEMRRRAKTINFAVLYGMADFTLSRNLGIPRVEAKKYIDAYFDGFPSVRKYIESTIDFAREYGYVSTLLGRRRYVPDIRNSNFNIRQNAERAAFNTPVQGTAADIMKLAMIKVENIIKKEKSNAKMLLQVHDELLFEVPEDELYSLFGIISRGMSEAYQMAVPLKVDVKFGYDWNNMIAVK